MTVGVQVQLGVKAGYATASTVQIVAASLAAGDITISGAWGETIITPSAIGAGYVGSATISGLAAFTRYTYTATQGSKSASGSFMTAPGARDDFSLFFAGCDKNFAAVPPFGDPTGFWPQIRDYAQNAALPTVGVFFVDDHGYVDTMLVDDSAGTGLAVSNLTDGPCRSGSTADYALAYLCNLGLLEDTTNGEIAWGRDDDRVWCWQHLNILPQWGDHEFINDFGFDLNKNPSGAVAISGGATGAQIWTAGKAAWDAFMKPLMPPRLNEVHGYGWAISLGCINLIAPDSITNSNGTWDRVSAPGSGEITSIYGTAQIDDVLNFVNANPKPFNLFGMANSIRYMAAWTGAADAVYNLGAQHPLYDHLLSEYQRLFTASGNTPKSLMDNNATNGVAGATILLHGDYHHACVLHHQKAAYTGNLAENFYSVHLGTINGSTNFTMPVAQGTTYNGSTLEYDSGWRNSGGNVHQFAGMRVDVYGSRSRPELHVTLIDSAGATMWAGKWLARSSNETVPGFFEIPESVGTSTDVVI